MFHTKNVPSLTCPDQEPMLYLHQCRPVLEIILRSVYQHVYQYVLTQHFLSLYFLHRWPSVHAVPERIQIHNIGTMIWPRSKGNFDKRNRTFHWLPGGQENMYEYKYYVTSWYSSRSSRILWRSSLSASWLSFQD